MEVLDLQMLRPHHFVTFPREESKISPIIHIHKPKLRSCRTSRQDKELQSCSNLWVLELDSACLLLLLQEDPRVWQG